MQRTIYAYALKLEPAKGKNIKRLNSHVEDIATILSEINRRDVKQKTEHFSSDCKIAYIDQVKYDKESGILELTFKSAKYGMVRKVIDTDTYADRGYLKKRPDGDLEKTHLMLKQADSSSAVLLYEYNKNGIGLAKLVSYISQYVKNWHHVKEDMLYYNMSYKNIVSKDFLKALEKINRIKAVTLTVDKEDVDVSDLKGFAGYRDVSNDMDIVFRPVGRGNTIFGNTVKDLFDQYNDKKKPIKRITVDGDRVTKEPLVFDTEQMKEKYPVEIAEDRNGEAISEDVFREMKKIMCYF